VTMSVDEEVEAGEGCSSLSWACTSSLSVDAITGTTQRYLDTKPNTMGLLQSRIWAETKGIGSMRDTD